MEDRYIVNIRGTNFVRYEGLLNEAHEKGLAGISVELVQPPMDENGRVCICKDTATGRNGEVFTDYGDASPISVDAKIAPHIVRMAATRAKARVLRDFTNIGMCSLEEIDSHIGDSAGDTAADRTAGSASAARGTAGAARAAGVSAPGASAAGTSVAGGTEAGVSSAERVAAGAAAGAAGAGAGAGIITADESAAGAAGAETSGAGTQTGKAHAVRGQAAGVPLTTVAPATQAQLGLLKKLAWEKNVEINYAELDKQKASRLIDELSGSGGKQVPVSSNPTRH